jgi:heat shock protein HslJ
VRLVLRLVGLAWVAVMLGGCLTAHDVLTDRPWRLVEVGGAAPIDPAGAVGVSFGTDGRFAISTGCISGGGTYHLDGNRILLDSEQLVPTPCPSALAGQHAAILAVIEGRPTYAIDTGTGRLRLTSEAGEVLLFEAP